MPIRIVIAFFGTLVAISVAVWVLPCVNGTAVLQLYFAKPLVGREQVGIALSVSAFVVPLPGLV